jgi:hypothetical protein
VPFALLPPPTRPAPAELRRPVRLYPLPPLPDPTGRVQDTPLDIRIDGDQIRILRPGGQPAPAGSASRPSAGWLIDLGPRAAGAPSPTALELLWPDADDINAVADLSSSDDLRTWRPAGSGALLALRSTGGETLRQARVPLSATVGRYLKLTWMDALQVPRLTGVQALTPTETEPASTQDEHLQFPALARAGGDRALQFDLGTVLPLRRIDLQLPPGTWLMPVRWQGRRDSQDPWQPIGAHVHYRLERHGDVAVSGPLVADARMRYLRALPDERAGAPDPAQVRLDVQMPPARLVFVAQGRPPYTLQIGLIGTAEASAPAPGPSAGGGALPLHTLIADPEAERARFGRAELGPWQEDADAAHADERLRVTRTWRPWLLWGVLLAGVAALSGMVWRLTRGKTAPDTAR